MLTRDATARQLSEQIMPHTPNMYTLLYSDDEKETVIMIETVTATNRLKAPVTFCCSKDSVSATSLGGILSEINVPPAATAATPVYPFF